MSVKTFAERPNGFNEYTNHLGQTVRIDPTKAHNLLCLLEAAKKTRGDIVIVYEGEEGSGKSTSARQDARFLDPTFTEKRIEFSPKEAKDAHFKGLPEGWDYEAYHRGEYESKPWQAIILDESAKLDRKRTMSAGSVEFNGFITQSRQLHKIFFIVLPSVHMLDGYVAEHRAVAVIHCYKHQKTEMVFYKWYGRKHIRRMFLMDMHSRKMYPKKAYFQGRFSNTEAFDISGYNRKKTQALNAYRQAEQQGIETMSPEDLRHKWEIDAEMNCVINGDDEASVYRSLKIPKRTWADRKKVMVEREGVKPGKLRAGKKRAFNGILPSNTEKDDYDYGIT